MVDVFCKEIVALLSARGEDVSSALSVKGVNDRIDAIALLVRDVLRSSSLCYIDGEFHFFNSCLYEPIKKNVLLAVLSNVLVDTGFSPTDVRKMGDMALSVVVERSFPRDPFLLCFSNGVLDLSALEFTAGFSGDRIVTEKMRYAYDPLAKCPAWEAFLSEVLPDESVRLVLQEFFGMCYLDRSRVSVEKFLLLIGSGANGKSVIFEVMKKVLGDDNVSTFDSQQLASEKMLPYLKGKRLNFVPDMKRSSDFDSSLKALSSGQDVMGRKIYGDAEKIKCPPLCFAMNEAPRFHDRTDAFFRRLIPIRFGVTIPPDRQDRALVEKIAMWDLPGIFNWAMEGRKRLVDNGGEFTPSRQIACNLEILRSEVGAAGSPVRSYLAGRGLSVYPAYEGQPWQMVSQSEIASAVGGITRTAITREMNRYGVAIHRAKEIYYRVYCVA